ncbi:MAG: type II secretion system minor pseudopilin GspJ [Pseudomonadota bacterium]
MSSQVRLCKNRHRAGAGGFTLVEVLVALAITVMVSATAYTSISAALASVDQLRAGGDRVRDLNRALAIVSRDLRQFSNRFIVDEFDEPRAPLTGGPLAVHPLELTRAGWQNSTGLPRSDLQRVFYYLEDGSLWRAYYQVLDRLGDSEPVRVRLLDRVEELELRFLPELELLQVDQSTQIDTRNWEQNWVVEPGTGLTPPDPPQAVEIRLLLEDFGELRRIYELPAQ